MVGDFVNKLLQGRTTPEPSEQEVQAVCEKIKIIASQFNVSLPENEHISNPEVSYVPSQKHVTLTVELPYGDSEGTRMLAYMKSSFPLKYRTNITDAPPVADSSNITIDVSAVEDRQKNQLEAGGEDLKSATTPLPDDALSTRLPSSSDAVSASHGSGKFITFAFPYNTKLIDACGLRTNQTFRGYIH
jgi:hypothetical protein